MGASAPRRSNLSAGGGRWGKDVPERSQTSEHIVGITREERQKDRPSDSRGRRAGRRPEEGRRSAEEQTPPGGGGEKGREKQRVSDSRRDVEGASRGVNDGRAGSRRGRRERERTHKTGKHVISPRRGERRGRGDLAPSCSSALPSPPLQPASQPSQLCRRPSVVGVPFLLCRFFRLPLTPFPCLAQSERNDVFYLFE